MLHSPLLCDPAEKAQREASNAVEQLRCIEYFVNERRIREVQESHVLDFHRFTVEGIYPCAGRYRHAGEGIKITGTAHVPPEAAFVRNHVVELVEHLNQSRDKGVSAIERAAHALWRLNWIHPFAGGNGRVSRALSYFVLCLDLGSVPTGRPQMPVTIAERRAEYDEALKAGDSGNLVPMVNLVEAAITLQLDNASERPRD